VRSVGEGMLPVGQRGSARPGSLSYRRTAVVEGDIRRPQLGRFKRKGATPRLESYDVAAGASPSASNGWHRGRWFGDAPR